jgi:hypothetical protein
MSWKAPRETGNYEDVDSIGSLQQHSCDGFYGKTDRITVFAENTRRITDSARGKHSRLRDFCTQIAASMSSWSLCGQRREADRKGLMSDPISGPRMSGAFRN